MNIFSLSMIHLREKGFFGCPRILRRIGEERNCPTLFRIGLIASLICAGAIFSNSCVQNCIRIGSLIRDTILRRNDSCVSMSGIEMSVVSGMSRSVRIVLRRIYSRRGPQLSANIFLKIETNPDATIGRSSGRGLSSMLNAIGYSVSDGSKRTISLVRDFGILANIVSARSPCGSMRPTPRPDMISE